VLERSEKVEVPSCNSAGRGRRGGVFGWGHEGPRARRGAIPVLRTPSVKGDGREGDSDSQFRFPLGNSQFPLQARLYTLGLRCPFLDTHSLAQSLQRSDEVFPGGG
jgi:hypothetical protein